MVSTIWSKCPKIFSWVSRSISRLRLTTRDKFGGYRKHSEVDFDAGKSTFRWSKNWNFFKIFEIPKFSLDFTDLHGYQFWALQWLLGIQKVCCAYLKVSPDFIWRWLFQQVGWGQKNSFFWPPEANMRFLTMILGRKGVQMTLSKFPISNFTGGQHAVNRRWPKSPKSWKNAISSKSIFCWKWLKQLLNWY